MLQDLSHPQAGFRWWLAKKLRCFAFEPRLELIRHESLFPKFPADLLYVDISQTTHWIVEDIF